MTLKNELNKELHSFYSKWNEERKIGFRMFYKKHFCGTLLIMCGIMCGMVVVDVIAKKSLNVDSFLSL
ncbi:MAG: hypothetical protein SPL99_10965 [Catonella sp.]|nr:hypothetical protein [Catonella sp.]MDY6356957.1 hypothetical protein [Catonella sp.]